MRAGLFAIPHGAAGNAAVSGKSCGTAARRPLPDLEPALVAPPLADTDVDLPSGRIGADPANVRAGGLANLTGVPGINLPVGLSGGLPIGLQLMAAWDREAVLLDAAEALERANGRRWVEALPPLAETTSAPA